MDLFVRLSDLFGVSMDYLIRGKASIDLSKSVDVTQLKSDVEKLVKQLERFKASL